MMFTLGRIFRRMACILSLTFVLVLAMGAMGLAFDWVPTDEEIQKYRKSWNPLSNGPIFISGVDVHPQGQFTFHPFLFSQISEKRFGNDLTTNRTEPPLPHIRTNWLLSSRWPMA
jgi:hypothetical protein